MVFLPLLCFLSVHQFQVHPTGDMPMLTLAEDSVEQAGDRKQAISARLAKISGTPCRDWSDLCGVVG